MFHRNPKPKPNTPVNPMDIKVGEYFSVDGVRFLCDGAPVVSTRDSNQVFIPGRRWGLRRLSVPINIRRDEVLVAR